MKRTLYALLGGMLLLPSCGEKLTQPTGAVLSPTSKAAESGPSWLRPEIRLTPAQNVKALEDGVVIAISKEGLFVDGQRGFKVEELEKRYSEPAPGTNPHLLLELAQGLLAKKDAPKKITLYVDQEVNFEIVWMASHTTALAGYDTSFVVSSKKNNEVAGLALVTREEDVVLKLDADGKVYFSEPRVPASLIKKPLYAGEVTEGLIKSKGPIEKETLQRFMRLAMPGVKFCYEQALDKSPRLSGELTVEFIIAPNGAFTSEKSKAPGISQDLDACVLKKIGQLRFPAPKKLELSTVAYTFLFQPAEENPSTPETQPAKALESQPEQPWIRLLAKKERLQLRAEKSTLIPNNNTGHDYQALIRLLQEIKKEHPKQNKLSIGIHLGVDYQDAIKIADACIQAGFDELELVPSELIF